MVFEKKYFYVIKLQYLGYRFHGWQKQPNVKTLHLMVDRTFNYILEGKKFKTLISGRTDAMVSAEETAMELFIFEPINDFEAFLALFNLNLPQDIRALGMYEVDETFNIIQHSKVKEYNYLFTYGEKCHPFCAPLMTTILGDLDIDIMIKGAQLFEGSHFMKAYCYKPKENGVYHRAILKSEIIINTDYTASFFPETTYMFKVRGQGFMRNQIRLMMGTLIELGQGKRTLEDITLSLEESYPYHMQYIAPASGLILKSITFE